MGIFDKISKEYDQRLRLDENLYFINYFRWRLLSQVQGKVLEVASGTGRNLGNYQYLHRMKGREARAREREKEIPCE